MGDKSKATPIAVLASGRGSNFEAIASAIDAGRLNARIVAVISDVPDALVLEKAQERGIAALVVTPSEAGDSVEVRRREHEKRILEALAPFQPGFLVLAGYMRIVSSVLLDAFRSDRGYTRIVNIHPSLLPAFPGLGSYAQAFRYGAKVAGVSVHLVEAGVDTGPICAQEAFSIADCVSEAEVERRGLEVEHRLFPATLQWLLKEEFQVAFRELKIPSKVERRLCVCPN